MNKIESIYLGTVKNDADIYDPSFKEIKGEKIYIEKHSHKDLDFTFGYITDGNEYVFSGFYNLFIRDSMSYRRCEDMFEDTILSNRKMMILRDLFNQVYTLYNASKVYQYNGGHAGHVDQDEVSVVKSKGIATLLVEDAEKVLQRIWVLLQTWESDYRRNKEIK